MKEVYVNSEYAYVPEAEQKQFDEKQAFNIDAEIRKGSLKEEEQEKWKQSRKYF